jgi:cytochrome b561
MSNTPATGTAAAPDAYTRPAVALHWLIAGLIACGFTLGTIMTDLPVSPERLRLFNYHKWIGITVLGLAFLRGVWRLFNRPPAMVPMPAWQAAVARQAHVFLYVLMFLVPLTGWLMSSAKGYPVVYLKLWQLPDLVQKNKELGETLEDVHSVLAWLMAAIVGLHAAGALKHHFIDRDDTLRHMLRWRSR